MPTKPFSTSLENFSFLSYRPHSVQVENISTHATISEVIELFKTLIDFNTKFDHPGEFQGNVKTFCAQQNTHGSFLEVEFFNEDDATKALCMSGYSIHGTPLFVTAIRSSSNTTSSKRQADDRKNLYVLGLPFSLTKTEFTALFSRYGTVTHSVILATVDNSSRRRGFVVMSTHEEAKLAMTSLTRTQIKGHCLDVSWAVVQRSQGKYSAIILPQDDSKKTSTGFLDGGDRAMLLDSRPSGSFSQSSASPSPDNLPNFSSSLVSSSEEELAKFSPSLIATPTIFLTNLPTLLFSDSQDISPLLCPFGRVKRFHVIKSPSVTNTSVLVEYESAEAAQEAKQILHGQHYIGHEITVCYVRRRDIASVPDVARCNSGTPLASNRQSPALLGPLPSCYDTRYPQHFPSSRRIFGDIQNISSSRHPTLPC